MSNKSLIGQNVLGYSVDEQIGSGGFGTVYKVSKFNASGSYVRALKHITIPTQKQYNDVLNSMGGDYSKADDYFAKVLQDIVSEIKILNSLSEKDAKNIVNYYENDIIEHSDPRHYDIYILMEYLTPFTDFFDQNELTTNDVIELGLNILSALKLCHENGIIHRDIKDDNIFITKDKRYKLGDFGVSKILKDKAKAESVKGTPNYIAPEVYLGKEKYTNTVDLYSLGIVMYKLLNHSRNPFLPDFPLSYDSDDEEKAFDQRIKGEIPPLPTNAPELLGKILVKAISNKDARYASADEFYNELISVKQQLSADELNKVINRISSSRRNAPNKTPNNLQKDYGETLGADNSPEVAANNSAERKNSADSDLETNKNLFLTLGQPVPPPPQDKEEVFPNRDVKSKTEEEKKAGKDTAEKFSHNKNDRIAREEVKPIEKEHFNWIIYLLPFIIAAIGVAVFLVIIPKVYGKSVNFVDWLFSGTDNIIQTLRDPNRVLPKVYNIILLKILLYAILTAFTASLFWVGKQLQKKEKPNASGAILRGKEAYFMLIKISSNIKEVQRKVNNHEINKLADSIKRLEEKLKIETDFAVGSSMVVDCENKIAEHLIYIRDLLPRLSDESNLEQKIELIESSLLKVKELLRERNEIKKMR